MVHRNAVQFVQHLPTFGVTAPPCAVQLRQRPRRRPLGELKDVDVVTELSKSQIEAMNEDAMRCEAARGICVRNHEHPHNSGTRISKNVGNDVIQCSRWPESYEPMSLADVGHAPLHVLEAGPIGHVVWNEPDLR